MKRLGSSTSGGSPISDNDSEVPEFVSSRCKEIGWSEGRRDGGKFAR